MTAYRTHYTAEGATHTLAVSRAEDGPPRDERYLVHATCRLTGSRALLATCYRYAVPKVSRDSNTAEQNTYDGGWWRAVNIADHYERSESLTPEGVTG